MVGVVFVVLPVVVRCRDRGGPGVGACPTKPLNRFQLNCPRRPVHWVESSLNDHHPDPDCCLGCHADCACCSCCSSLGCSNCFRSTIQEAVVHFVNVKQPALAPNDATGGYQRLNSHRCGVDHPDGGRGRK